MLNRLIGNKESISMIDEMLLAQSVIVKRIKYENHPTKQMLKYKFELKKIIDQLKNYKKTK